MDINFRYINNYPALTLSVLKDTVFRVLIVLSIVLLFVDSEQLIQSMVSTINSLWEMLPFFVLAIGFAAYFKATGADGLIAKAFSGNPLRSTFLAASVGAVSPFCSCGVIPLIAAMLGAGVPLGPVMAFWIASPIMDPEMFVLTAAGIGFNFAVFKMFSAFFMGLFAGCSVLLIQFYGGLDNPLKETQKGGCRASYDKDARPDVEWLFWKKTSRVMIFKSESISIGIFLGKWLTLAFFLESLMVAYISSDWIVSYVGQDNWLAIPIAAIVGAPSYLNGYAAIPLVSGLIEIGMSPAAAMAFINAGAVSSVPAAIAVWALVKKPVFILYLSLGLFGAMATALIYQLFGSVL